MRRRFTSFLLSTHFAQMEDIKTHLSVTETLSCSISVLITDHSNLSYFIIFIGTCTEI